MTNVDYIIAGYERGGTTLLSELFRANGFESGFECGVLLGDSPAAMSKIKPYWDMLLDGWKIDKQIRKRAIMGDFRHFYEVITSSAFPDHVGPFFDKTPKYMEHIGRCLKRADFVKGAVVIHRDPRAFFVSATKRISPELPIEQGIIKNFNNLTQRYISYFIGCIAHQSQPNVLFVPFEELVSREDAWLKALGLFTIGRPFVPRKKNARFANVTSDKMDLGKIIEFDHLLSPITQEKILDATKLASPFFAGPVERAKYSDLWQSTIETAKKRLSQFERPAVGMEIEGVYFEPLTYLIRYPDILKSGVDPVRHYQFHGHHENRQAA